MNNFKKPNVILVLTDDQGYGDLGCTGNPIINTPNINKFYKESLRLTNYHVGPTCAPTRSGLMTGHYANSTGVWHTIGGRSLLRKNEWTIADALSENGYATGIFGKWHLGDSHPYRAMDRGFNKAIVHGGGGISQTPDFWGNDYFDDTYSVNGELKKFKGYCTDVFFEEGLKFIEENREKPFFAYISCNAPHGPLNVDEEYIKPYRGKVSENRARYYGMITNIDENFGLLIKKLKEWELEDDTILIFMTDNGTCSGAKFDADGFVIDGYNVGLRGGKCSEYDGGHRVPFFIRWNNGGIDTPRDINALTANVDFMPTILDLCGIDFKEDDFHGKSLKKILKGSSADKDRVIVTDSQRLANPCKWRKSAVMTNQWRLINGTELYDINLDREQRNNIADMHKDIVCELRNEYEKWWEIVSKQFDETIPITIGEEKNSLTCHDWRNEDCNCVHHQGLIRQGKMANGYFEILVSKSGKYTFSLRRWPKEANREITNGIEGDDVEWKKESIREENYYYYNKGRAIPIVEAGIEIQGNKMIKEVKDSDFEISFCVDLKEGETNLKTWFLDEEKNRTGAYYVDVYKEA